MAALAVFVFQCADSDLYALTLYRSGDKVVCVYTVGDVTVHEMPELETVDGQKVLSRTLNLTASTKPLTVVVADVDGKRIASESD